ncbi:MAG TPA: uroporphyrinogen-III synthase [Bryobacteraceae bacterium]|nr:uroporphyrinogen-III synthase [Bryobacteraceae bacterium]
MTGQAMKAQPLAGERVVVTRASGQGDLAARLRALGADVIEFPTIEIQAAADYGPLDAAIGRISSYGWIIFTSANGVRFFLQRLARANVAIDAVRAALCAIGPATREAAENAGFRVSLMPAKYVAEGLVRAFERYELKGARILLPRAAVARDVVPDALRARGAVVDVVEAYRTAIPEGAQALAREIFGNQQQRPGWITFTSSSTVRHFVEAAGVETLQGVRVASIGPVTSATARECGITITVEAANYTSEGLVEALVNAARH